MTVFFNNYRVKSSKSGWIVQQRVGKQWKESRYFTTTESLVDTLLKEQFHKQTEGFVYYSTSEDGAFYLLEEINSRLKAVREEIIGVYNG